MFNHFMCKLNNNKQVMSAGKLLYQFTVNPFRNMDKDTREVKNWSLKFPVKSFPSTVNDFNGKTIDLTGKTDIYTISEHLKEPLDKSYYELNVTVDSEFVTLTALTENALRNGMNEFLKSALSCNPETTAVKLIRTWDIRVREVEPAESSESSVVMDIFGSSSDSD